MYKLMIVDDFDIDRSNLKECIDWDALGIRQIIEASNGYEALEKLVHISPDFVLTDIQMPFMDGIKLADTVKKSYPGIKVVFTSYYNDFEYVRSAVDLNAYGYLLKPVIPEEVVKCFKKVIAEYEAEKERNKIQLEARKVLEDSKPFIRNGFIKNVFCKSFKDENSVFERSNYLEVPLTKGYFKVILLELHDEIMTQKSDDVESIELFNIALSMELEQICKRLGTGISAQINDIHYTIIINSHSLDKIEGKYSLLADELSRIITCNNGNITVGVSRICSNVMELADLYDQCLYTLKYKFCLGKGQIIYYNDVCEAADIPKIDLSVLQKEVNFLVNVSDKKEIDLYIDKLFENIIIDPENSYIRNLCFGIILSVQMVLNEHNQNFEGIFGDDRNIVWNKLFKFETIVDMKQWLKNILYTVSYFIEEIKNKRNNHLVYKVIEYIKDNYNMDIAVKDIAERFYFSPNYLNNLFRKHTGRTIPEFITAERIERAKHMLMEEDLKVYEIVEKVGYFRTSYFVNLFKKHTGVTPREYRGTGMQEGK